MDGSSIARDTEHGRAVTAQLTRRHGTLEEAIEAGDLRARRRGAVQGHPAPGAHRVRGLLLQPAQPGADRRVGRTGRGRGKSRADAPTRCTGHSRTSSSLSWTATTRSSAPRSRDRLELEDLRRRVEDDCPEALVLPPREIYGVEALTKSDDPNEAGLGLLPRPVDRDRPCAPAHRGRARGGVGRALHGDAERHPALIRALKPGKPTRRWTLGHQKIRRLTREGDVQLKVSPSGCPRCLTLPA